MSTKPPNPPQIQIEVPGDLRATYANFAIINHAYNEVVIDLAHIVPNAPQNRVHTRLVMTPYHAKLLLNALSNNLAHYETHFGEIVIQGGGLPDRGHMGFEPSKVH